ncbi:MAG TPA: hypothetical protein PLN38_04780 [Chitinophagales bacterium]|jgi:hypothetical protein|nr:hypothetical protein [Chitinophagales bacterium]
MTTKGKILTGISIVIICVGVYFAITKLVKKKVKDVNEAILVIAKFKGVDANKVVKLGDIYMIDRANGILNKQKTFVSESKTYDTTTGKAI